MTLTSNHQPGGSIPSDQFNEIVTRLIAVEGGAGGYYVVDAPTGVEATDTAAINAKLGPDRVVVLRPGIYVVTGDFDIPRNCKIVGMGVGATIIRHVGNNFCFTYEETTSYITQRAGIEDVWIQGNSGAVAGGVRVRGSWGYLLRRVLVGDQSGGSYRYSGASGVGVLLENFTTNTWVEGFKAEDLHLGYNTCGLRLQRVNGTNSFGYLTLKDFQINVPASGTGIDFGGSSSTSVTPYNCVVEGVIWLDGNSATAIHVQDVANIEKGNRFHVRGEVLGGATGCVRVKFNATATGSTIFKVNGYFDFEGGGTVTDAYNGGAPTVRISGADHKNVTGARTAIVPVVHGEHQGIAFSKESNEETVWLHGYNSSESPIVAIAAKGFTNEKPSAWDPTANLRLYVTAGGILCLGTVATHVEIHKGSANPEGAVTAPKGSMYLRHDAGTTRTLYTKESGSGNTGWVLQTRGVHATVASAATIAIPSDESFLTITGTTGITDITIKPAGYRVTLVFQDVLTVTDGGTLKLAGNFVTSGDDTLDLISNGSNWYETGRSVN